MTGSVYYIACSETRRLKIGFTAGDPVRRLRSLQTGAAGVLRLIAVRPGTRETEAELHDRFRDRRLHGEWFEMDEDLFTHLCEVIWIYATMVARNAMPVPEWLILGLQMLEQRAGQPLPDELHNLIVDGAPDL